MTARLTEKLASVVLGWKLALGRFIKPGRRWTPAGRFTPLTSIEQALDLLERTRSEFCLIFDEWSAK